MQQRPRESSTDAYTVRRFQSKDIEPFLSLYESVWGWRYYWDAKRRPDREWFEWKYGKENPFYDDVPVVVAETNGDVVGAKPHVPLRLRANDGTLLALAGTDTMVHEDHRGHGLFSRMIEHTLERYADQEPALTFNFPNDLSLPGYRKKGWYVLDNRNVTACRIQDPRPFVRRYGGPAGPIGAPIANALTRTVNSLLDEVRGSADGVTVTVNPSNPADVLGSISQRTADKRLHVERDDTYYRWLLDEPTPDPATTADVRTADRTVYVGHRRGKPVAGAVVDTMQLADTEGYHSRTELVDVVPLASDERSAAVTQVLGRVLEDARSSHVVRAPENALSTPVRRSLGFVSGTNPVLSSFNQPSGPLAIRPLGEQYTVNGVAVTDPENWLVTNAEPM